MTERGSRRQTWAVCLLLTAAVLAVYGPALHCGFIEFDDTDYVTHNGHIQHGLNWAAIQWAFTTDHCANWHPLTWLSHLVDFQLYGLNPAGHHATSVLFHLANSLLLFLLLRRLTGAVWRSAFVAGVFALHPLRLESVVWVSERKDVLSTFFGFLAVWAYVRYVEEFKVRSSFAKATEDKGSKFKLFYAAALVLFALGLMAKPMLVTLPFVLLLLDYWPLDRFRLGWRLVLEKVPFFLLALGSSVVTFLVQHHEGAMATLARFSVGTRLANVPVAYVRYLFKNAWPSNLALFYPHERWGALEVAGAVGLLGAITGWVVWRRRAQPYLAVGWFWFLGMLFPTIGLVQVGEISMADRYSYLPSVGLWIMVAWGLNEWAGSNWILRRGAAGAGGLALLALAASASAQIRYWHDTAAIFSHVLEVTGENYIAYYNMGCAVMESGDYPKAIECFEGALSAENAGAFWMDPAQAHNNLGYALLHEGRIAQAVAHFEKALVTKPAFPEAYYNLGRAFVANHQPEVALDCFQRAMALNPNVPEIHYTLAETFRQLGRRAEAIEQYRRALELRPGWSDAASQLAALEGGKP